MRKLIPIFVICFITFLNIKIIYAENESGKSDRNVAENSQESNVKLDKKNEIESAKNLACASTGPSNACYANGSTCYGVVLVCHSCCYDAVGNPIGEKDEVCGGCIGLPWII